MNQNNKTINKGEWNMFYNKYKNIAKILTCATAFTTISPLMAREAVIESENYCTVKGGTVKNTPLLKTYEIKDLEGPNLIGGNLKITPPKNEWECKIPQGKAQKGYNLLGIALFSGNDPISFGIKALTHSKISHVGILVADQDDENKWFCFESTGAANEVIKGEYPHVRITPWQTVIDEYNGKVSYRLLVFNNILRIPSAQVTDFVEKYDGKSYTKNPFKLIKALLKANKQSDREVLNTAFCSELTAQMLMILNILKRDAASNYIPKDFCSTTQIPLNYEIELTPEYTAK